MSDNKLLLSEEIYDISPCGFFSAKPDGTITNVNNTFIEMTGYKRDELLSGMNWQELLTIGGKIFYETHFAPLLRMHSHVKEINFDFQTKEGKVPVLMNAILVNDKKNKPEITHFSVLDITQRKLYEQELLSSKRKAEELVRKLSLANADLAQFAHIVSHDLQTPITAIRGYLEILQVNEKFDDETTDILSKLLKITDRMSFLIKDILEYSKLERVEEDTEDVDLNEVWDYVVTTFEGAINESNARIITPPMPVIKGNKTQIIRLLQNLLSNSLKYRSDKDPIIELSCSKLPKNWKFTFKDNGIGFSQEDADKVFKFLQRLPTKDKYSGTGIGLAASKRIVEMYGGEIWVSSEPGEGSSFYFTLPISKENL